MTTYLPCPHRLMEAIYQFQYEWEKVYGEYPGVQINLPPGYGSGRREYPSPISITFSLPDENIRNPGIPHTPFSVIDKE